MSHDDARMKSFKVTIRSADKDKTLQDELWPEGIMCRQFSGRRDISSNGRFQCLLFNVTRIKREPSQKYTFELLREHKIDILLLRETWLLDSQSRIITNICANYAYTCRSGVNSKCDLIVGRPSGGVAILWHESLSKCVKPVVINNNRLCVIEILSENQSKILIMCCYLPCDSRRINDTGDDFPKCLDLVQMCIAKGDYDEILFGGYLNVDLKRNTGNSKYSKQFCSICELEFAWNHLNAQPGVTHESYDGLSPSIIDHFLVSNPVWQNIRNVTVIDDVRNSVTIIP